MLLQNGENQLNVSSLKAVCTVKIQQADFFKHRRAYTFRWVSVCACMGREGEEKKRGGGFTDRLKLGTFVAARHFSRQPADMTAKAGERRVAGS